MDSDETDISGYQQTKLNNHMKRDYTNAPGVLKLGLRNPVPIVAGTEALIVCEDDEGKVVISMEEAVLPEDRLGRRFYLPTPEEIEQRAKEARKLFRQCSNGAKRYGARHNWELPQGEPEPGIREVATMLGGRRIAE